MLVMMKPIHKIKKHPLIHVRKLATKNLSKGDNLKTLKLKKDEALHQHEPEVLSVIFGGLLGDSFLRKQTLGVSIRFGYSAKNIEYAQFLHTFFSSRGYASETPLKIKTVQPKSEPNILYFTVSFGTFSFKSFNELHEMFYRKANTEEVARGRKFIKVIPQSISEYLTPLALAIWVQDDGIFMKSNRAFKLSTDGFLKEEVELLQKALETKFNLNFNILKAGVSKQGERQYQLYLPNKQVPNLINLIKEFMVPSMLYKLGIDNEGKALKAPIIKFDDVKQILTIGVTAQSFATWFLKNGTLKPSGLMLFLQNASKEDAENLQLLLQTTFNLNFTFDAKKHLLLSKEQLPLLISIIKPFIPSVLYSKLGLSSKKYTRKHVQNILKNPENFDAKVFADWFMVNGSFEKNDKLIKLSTQGASKEEAETLILLLEKNFNLVFTADVRRGTQNWTLRLSRIQVPILINTIKPFMMPSVYYKLGLGLSGESLFVSSSEVSKGKP